MLQESPPIPCPVCEAAITRFFMTVSGQYYHRCPHCMATFLDPDQRPAASVEKAEYDQHRNEVHDPGYRRFLGKLADVLVPCLESGAKGLDFGCGPGPALVAMLNEAGLSTVGYDPFYAPDQQPLSQRYDFITCTEVVEHLHDPAGTFRLLDQCLKPGGMLGVMTCFQTDDDRFAGWHYRRDPTHVVFYREQTMQVLAGRFGWACTIPRKDVALFRKGAPGD